MIREQIEKANSWYNRKDGSRQLLVLLLFCVGFLLIGWLSIRYINCDTKAYHQDLPANIGSPSGILPNNSSKHQ